MMKKIIICTMFFLSLSLFSVDPIHDYIDFKKERDALIARFSERIQDDWTRGRRIIGGKLVYPQHKIEALKDAPVPRIALRILEQINNDQGDLFENISHIAKILSERIIEENK